MAAPEITFFVACYNEAPNIVATLETLHAAVRRVGCSCEVIVIDDASTDDSAALVRAYQRAYPEQTIRLQTCPNNRGLARNFVEACASRSRPLFQAGLRRQRRIRANAGGHPGPAELPISWCPITRDVPAARACGPGCRGRSPAWSMRSAAIRFAITTVCRCACRGGAGAIHHHRLRLSGRSADALAR